MKTINIIRIISFAEYEKIKIGKKYRTSATKICLVTSSIDKIVRKKVVTC